ncbi:hypothetical protein [Pelagicoccus sp. SDUM812005]|uniref:hypothetical protein n=1 Tax=Pelagicoccus sp. SDUM812005 TaxID=3041257 RepID=UPI00280F6B92|nr:hypothetical protein [Pelagicoccus sp. SDUM812005]MDQ8180734.1 hypothetical protein [Pelagicoccus sp. SDUM812005]
MSDFYDSRRIADWVEQHQEVAVWLRSKLGQPLEGWKPYGAWAYREENPDSEYLIDDRVKVFAPNSEEGMPVADAIAQLRAKLQRSVSIRIVGLSGVGKTRLVQALFDERVCPNLLFLDPGNVIYGDLADNPYPSPTEMVERLVARGSDSVVVVDNCGFETHARLTEIVRRSESRLKLISIEYDIRDDIPEGTDAFRLEGSSPEIISQLVSRKYKRLSQRDRERIAEFSDGNARVAFALASTAEVGGELCELRDEVLFLRLFEQQRRPSEELLHSSEVASLLYSFDGDDFSDGGELALLACLAEVSTLRFSKHIAELRRRGLVQSRAQWRAVLPHAIANRLAARCLDSLPVGLIVEKLILGSGDRVARSFTRRLGYLHDCRRAVEIATMLLEGGGVLGEPFDLSGFQMQMFENLAPVAPKAALDAIVRSLLVNALEGIRNQNGNRLVRVTREIAYDAEFFDDAVRVLIKFALGVSRDRFGAGARDALKTFCQAHLSGTHATPSQRHQFASELSNSTSEYERELGLGLITAGLKTTQFSSSYDSDFGAKRRDHGWRPKSGDDLRDWYFPWIEMAVQFGEADASGGKKFRAVLGASMRGLCRVGVLRDALSEAAERLKAIDGWGEGWAGVREALAWDVKDADEATLSWLRSMESKLAPSNLIEEIRAKVISPKAPLYDLESQSVAGSGSKRPSGPDMYRIAEERRIALGEKAAVQPLLLKRLIPELCSSEVKEGVFDFGFGAGSIHPDKRGFLDEVRSQLCVVAENSLNIRFVLGFVSGWSRSDPESLEAFLDSAIGNSFWITWFVSLQTQSGISGPGYERLCAALDSAACPTGQFSCLRYGRSTEALEIGQIATLIGKLSQRPDSGLVVALDVLTMVVSGSDGKDESYCRELGRFVGDFLAHFEWENEGLQKMGGPPLNFEFEQITKLWIKYEESASSVALIIKRILETDERYSMGFEDCRREVLAPIFEKFPVLALDLVFGETGEKEYNRARLLMKDRYSDRKAGVIDKVPTDILMEWCSIAPESRYQFIANICSFFKKVDGNSGLKLTDIGFALWKSAPDKKAVLAGFVGQLYPLSWMGSLANTLERRLRLFDELEAVGRTSELALAKAKAKVQTWVDDQRAKEQEEERLRNLSFE